MKNLKRQSYKIVLFVFGLVVVFAGIIVITQLKRQNKNSNMKETITEIEKESILDEAVENDVLTNGYIISTPVGELRYPKMWKDDVRTEEITDDDGFRVVVFGKIGEREVKLFTIFIGSTENDGYLFGSAPDNNGNMAEICIAVDAFETDDSWNEEDANEIYAMQEGVNYIIEQVNELAGFIPAK